MARLSISGADGPVITLNGRRVVSFGGCNYLGLSWHPDVRAALVRGLERYGVSTSASRETTGNSEAHEALEESLRKFLGVDATTVVPDGYTANLAAAQALALTHRASVVDSRCHRSIREAITVSGMAVRSFEHRDVGAAASAVRELSKQGRVALWTDGVFAADGSVSPVPELVRMCRENGATLVVDDCHGFCAIGRTGRGTLEHFGIGAASDIVITTTLAKGLGCHGGVIAGGAALTATIRARASAYICTTPVSPAIAAAAVEALAVVDREPARLSCLKDNAARLGAGLDAMGLAAESGPAPVFAFTLPEMRTLHEHLLQAGFLAPLIDYPDGPAPAYFRISVSSEHTPEQMDGLCARIGEWLAGKRRGTVAAGRAG
jgi:8-amino-7-oxononanoate synthase